MFQRLSGRLRHQARSCSAAHSPVIGHDGDIMECSRRKVVAGLSMWLAGGLARATPGVRDDAIHLGASMVLSGPLGPQTAAYAAGSRLLFDSVNARGGVHGRRITYTTLDDGFDVARAVANTRRLIEQDKVFLIHNCTGTAHTAAILPIARETRTIVFGPVTGAASLRRAHERHLFHVRAGYGDEAVRIARQLKELGSLSIATAAQDDAFGQALLTEVKQAAQAAGLSLAAEVAVNPKQPDFDTAARQLAAAGPQAIVMCTAGGTFTGLVKALRATAARPTLYGFSVVSVDQTVRDLGQDARGIVLAQVMPSLANRANPVVDEFLALHEARAGGGVASPSTFEGFMHARVLVEGLRRAGRALDTERLIDAFEGAGEIAYGKFALRYTPQSHRGSSYVELAIIGSDGRLRY
jgi:branched-chain amino acid transport system substrate-binding protein